jgi:ribosome-interacting GTPase 1
MTELYAEPFGMSTEFGRLIRPTRGANIQAMTDDDSAARRHMRSVGEEFRDTRSRLDDLRKQVHDAIPRAVADGMRVSDIAKLTGYDRERVRRIARDAGVEDQRPRRRVAPTAKQED